MHVMHVMCLRGTSNTCKTCASCLLGFVACVRHCFRFGLAEHSALLLLHAEVLLATSSRFVSLFDASGLPKHVRQGLHARSPKRAAHLCACLLALTRRPYKPDCQQAFVQPCLPVVLV